MRHHLFLANLSRMAPRTVCCLAKHLKTRPFLCLSVQTIPLSTVLPHCVPPPSALAAGHCLMFKHRVRSYRELPMRLADFGVLHRNEYRWERHRASVHIRQ